jgi:hypothetical protein
MTFGSIPPRALTKDLIARMITYRLQVEAFGGLDRATIKLLDRLARGEKPELGRRLKAGTVVCTENLIRIDCATESPNVNGDDRALLAFPDPVCLAVQVKEPT